MLRIKSSFSSLFRNKIIIKFLMGFGYGLLCLSLIYSIESRAVNNVLDQIDVDNSKNHSIITVSYIKSMNYRSHTPNNNGNFINISVIFQNRDDANELESEFLTWQATDSVPLFEVSLEPNNAIHADLVLRFNHIVDYEVLNSTDIYSIKIKVFHPQSVPIR